MTTAAAGSNAATEEKLRDYLKRATADLRRARQRVRELEETEPIAIVGMACRYPGGVRTPEQLWRLVDTGGDAISGFPTNRGWDLDALYDPDPDRPGTSYTREGGFLHDADEFDAAVFGISPREALAMDPQQRLVLETAWEVFERAGINPRTLAGSPTGVFVGMVAQGYASRLDRVPESVEGYLGTGSAASVISGRVSYTFGLEGPAVTVDTACSSSLVALHLAVQALRAGECTLALAGGATVMATPGLFMEFSRQRGLAADGRSKAFAAAADGTSFAEGTGMLLLERLSDARRLGHPVLAVVRGSAVNQDGASNGLTAPSGQSQRRVIEAALANARVSAGQVDAVEAHGTGTSLGDPIEAQALLATYGQARTPENPLRLGALKSNIGHTQAAAGVAGVIKMVLAMRHGRLPRTLHVDAPSPEVDWSSGNVALLTEQLAWLAGAEPRRAGVSAFGVSGTNAHVILEEAPPAEEPGDAEPVAQPPLRADRTPWPLAGHTDAALAGQAARLAEFVNSGSAAVGPDAAELAAVGRTLATARAALDRRAVALVADRAGADAALAALAQNATSPAVVRGGVLPDPGVVFVFPGQGSQWAGMATGLLDRSPVFAARIAECEAALAPYVDWSLAGVLRGEPAAPGLDRVDVVQPVLWAVMVSLAAVWQACGVRPAAVVGHSQGEIAAACVAGALSLADGAKVVAVRSRALLALAGRGGMVSVPLPAAEVSGLLADYAGLGIAALNGPASTVVSGDAGALERLLTRCEAEGVRAKRVDVDYASHSPHVEAVRDGFRTGLAGLAPRPATVPFYSTLQGAPVDTGSLDAGYWYRNLREPVRFAPVVRRLLDDGFGIFVEVSAHPVLTVGVEESIEEAGADACAVGTLRRDDGGAGRMLTSLAEAWTRGAPVDWPALLPAGPRADLPTYAFQRRRFWLEAPPAGQPAAGPTDAAGADPGEAAFWAAVEAGDPQLLVSSTDIAVDGARDAWAAVLPALAEWRRARRRRTELDRWSYRVAWRRQPEPATPTLTGRWLVLVPDRSVAPALAGQVIDALAAAGAEPVPVPVDAACARREAAAARLRMAAGAEPVAGVLSLLALDEQPHGVEPLVPAGVAATATAVLALADAGLDAPLWCLTSGAVSTGPGDRLAHPVQAHVWGLGRVAALERPAQWGGLVDVPAELDRTGQARLCAVLAGLRSDGADGTEDQCAIRATGVHARRLVRADLGDAPATAWRPRGTVLVTGGTGALGSRVARWLAGHGAQHLVLTSRRGPDAPGADELAAELRGLGVPVTVARCDVADRDALAAVLAAIPAELPLTAVVHTAGITQASPLEETGLAEHAAIVAGNSVGAAHLDELLAGTELDAFVLFSSNAGVWGSGGQAAYAGANAYLDALAEHRRARGAKATSLAWGAWGGGGLAATDGAGEQLRRRGVLEMDPETAMAAFAQAVGRDETFRAVADVDWSRFVPGFTARRPSPLLAELPEVQAALGDAEARPTDDGPAAELARRVAATPEAERERLLLDLVLAEVAPVLGYDQPGAFEASRPFKDLGFDSLTAVELRNRLRTATGLKLPATLVFDYPTPLALARHVRDELLGADAPAPVAVVATGSDEPIAIVGMACRYPGGVSSPEDLWQLVLGGRDAVSGFPTDRGWDVDGVYDPDPDAPGKSYVREGGFLTDASLFDAGFFSISPREALAMDPQQRLLLETAWEAFERAGLDPAQLRGTPTGVYVGTSHPGYGENVDSVPDGVEGHLLFGGSAAVTSGRLAYTFGLEGPAVTVDTMCSSSLVALHLAVQALRSGECTMALACGVAIMVSPGAFIAFSRQRGLSPDGRCKPFSTDADGTGWGEGVGVLLLEPLSAARRNGHRILAVVRGSATNQDGASNGLSAPNGPSQQRVIRAALANARLAAEDVDAVEAHGTGTRLGDPIEAQALLATYGRARTADDPLYLGALKSNIGHTQAASGVAGVIKTVQALRHGVLPATLHVGEPTDEVDWSAGTVSLLTEARPWPERGRPRRAGVSAFGGSGTNAHVILEQAPAADPIEIPSQAAGIPVLTGATVMPWPLSARSAAALAGQADRLARYTAEHPDLPGAEVARTLAAGRSVFEHRAVVVGGLSGVRALAEGVPSAEVVTGTAGDSRVVFVFPGQGSQWAGMAVELLESSPVFAARVAECELALAPFVDWSLVDVLRDGSGLDRVDVVQPVLWAVMVSLAAVWRAVGVEPAAVVGHSQGEIAAACVAGALSLADGARVVALRSRALLALAGRGGMVSVPLPAAEVERLLAEYDGRLSIAAVNGPSSTVVSGDVDALDELLAACEAENVRAKRIAVDYASHSNHVDELREELLSVLSDLQPQQATVPFYSTVTGERLDTTHLNAEYWVRNLREPVRFAPVIAQLAQHGYGVFVEASPHPVLTVAIGETLDETGASAIATGTLRRDEGGPHRLLLSLAEAWTHGAPVDWTSITGRAPAARLADLPTYSFQRERYWLEAGTGRAGDPAGLGLAAVGHPLLGAAVPIAGTGTVVLTGRLSTRTQPWTAEHAVGGTVLLPGTAFVELAIRAGDEVGCPELEDLTLEAPLVLLGGDAVDLQVVLEPADPNGRRALGIHARADGADGWTRHATGTLTAGSTVDTDASLAVWPPAGAEPVDITGFYPAMLGAGYHYGPAFQGLRAVWRSGAEIFAEVALPAELHQQAGAFGLHPALLDAALQAMGFGSFVEGDAQVLPFAWSGVGLAAAGAAALRVRIAAAGPNAVSVHAADPDGRPVARIERLALRPVSAGQLAAASGPDALFRVAWTALEVPAGTPDVDEAAELTVATVTTDALLTTTADVLVLPLAAGAHDTDETVLAGLLAPVQRWLADEGSADSRLAVVTSGAVSTRAGEDVPGLPHAGVWGLLRSAQSEHPGRLLLVDARPDHQPADLTAAIRRAVAAGEPQLALRGGAVLVPRLARAGEDSRLAVPDQPAWRLDTTEPGTLENLALVPFPEAEAPLAEGQVRIAVRAAGLNFRDVLIALAMYPGAGFLGNEGAGVIVETGPGVTGFAVGDRVLGMLPGGFGPLAVADARMLAPMPAGWTYPQAAAVPIAFATAWYGLVRLGGLTAGQRVLVHAAAGGVGMAAVQLARHLGAEVYATASQGKWPAVQALGVPAERLFSSRDTGFEAGVLAATGGAGVDVVLDSLAGEFVDASLRLLPRGGRFLEMGRTDVRDAEAVAAEHPGVAYRAYDLAEAGPELIGDILRQVVTLLDDGRLPGHPRQVWDIRQAPAAFRHMSQARHVGKLVLTMPRTLDPDGTVLITGGTGTLGALLARHLVTRHGTRHLVLASRRGPDAVGVPALREELAELGAEVTIAACDVADRDQLAGVLAAIPAEHPLTGVLHAAAALDDGVFAGLTPDRLGQVLRAKAGAARLLHELTADAELAVFALFSSASGVFGTPGQANYAAANTVVDALAAHRHAAGLPAVSLAWGYWEQASGLTGHLADGDVGRMSRGGARPLTTAQGLALFDAAIGADEPLLVPIRLDLTGLRGQAAAGAPVPPLYRGLVRAPVRRVVTAGGADPEALTDRLARLAPEQRLAAMLDVVRGHVATVLGHSSTHAVDPARGFVDLGFDSLTAVELRNRLGAATGVKLPATVVFDYPSADALARHLLESVLPEPADPPAELEPGPLTEAESGADADAIADMDVDALVQLALGSNTP